MVELGITIGCIAVLVMIVMTARGFINDAKGRSTIQRVRTLQEASYAWSERVRGGLGFAGGGIGQSISVAAIASEGLIPAAMTTGWGDPMAISSQGGSSSVPSYTYVIRFCVPTTPIATDMARMMADMGTVARSGGCGCNGCGILLTGK